MFAGVFIYTLKLTVMFVYFAHYNQRFPVSSLPGEVSHNFGSDRMSTHVGCDASRAGQLQIEPRVQFNKEPADGRQAVIMLLRGGVQRTAGGLCQHILAPFSSILLLSTRIYDLHTSTEL